MDASRQILPWLLAPLAPSAFFAKHWEKQPAHIRRENAAYFAGVLALDDIDQLLTSCQISSSSIRLAQNNRILPIEQYAATIPRDGVLSWIVNIERILSLYREGATIVLDSIDECWLPVSQLCRALENETAHPFQANMYLTPPHSKGFDAHFDEHDVFILQLHGEKRWRIQEKAVVLPFKGMVHDAPLRLDTSCVIEVDLHAGELIYIPRGFVHQATSGIHHSAHLSLGVMPTIWNDVFAEAMALLTSHCPELRSSAIVHVPRRGPQLRDMSSSLILELSRILPVKEALNRILARD